MKRAHRLVILPDYQGIGLGVRFLGCVAEHYERIGHRFSIVTSARNLCCALARSEDWILRNYGVYPPGNKKKVTAMTAAIIRSARVEVKKGAFYWRRGEALA